jgi:L-lactate dehydrogenase (cytochrome)
MPTLNLAPAGAEDYRRQAERNLPRSLFDYIDGGASAEHTLRANVAELQSIALRQRVLRDVSAIDTSTDLLDQRWAMPLALAPIGMAGMMARRAEVQAARAAHALGVPFCLSTVSICSLEEVARATPTPPWFQLYVMRDRGAVADLIARAQAVGVTTLVVTVDLAVVGARYRDIRNGMGGGLGAWGRFRGTLGSYLLHPGWLAQVGIGGKPHTFGNLSAYVPKATTPADFKSWIDSQFDPAVTWTDIEAFRAQWPGKLVVKGLLDAEDARAAVAAGADAVVVSNHGGRQLDGALASARALPRIVDALAGRTTVLVDGGVRTGQDIARMRALGADATLIGRPWVWAVAAGGEPAVKRLLGLLQAELRTVQALTACPRNADLGPEIIDRA